MPIASSSRTSPTASWRNSFRARRKSAAAARSKRYGTSAAVLAKVNDLPVAFLFDTGASTVVLRAQDAAKVGVDSSGLDFDVSVVTANGAAMAAQTRLDKISVGPIVMRDVRALVARPGALSESLLGMSFLDRLQSYSVERGRLVLKGK